MKHLDINGQAIQPGVYVAYAALWDRSATLKYGVVVKLKERKHKWNDSEPVEYTVGVVSVDRTSDWEAGVFKGVKWTLQAKGKEITLSFLDRMLVVADESVPLPVRTILHGYKPGA